MVNPTSTGWWEEGKITSFSVLLENKLKQRKKRILVIDTVERTLSRRTVKSKRKEISSSALTSNAAFNNLSNGFQDVEGGLRKTIPITTLLILQPSETDKCKLHLYGAPDVKQTTIIFPVASSREKFGSIIRKVRADVAKSEEERRRKRNGKGPSRLQVFTTTWNIGNKSASSFMDVCKNSTKSLLEKWIPAHTNDIYVIALQECKKRDFPDWQQLLHQHLNHTYNEGSQFNSTKISRLIESYKVLVSVSMWNIHCICFVRAELIQDFFHIHTDSIARGFGGNFPNKGAVGLSFEYGEGATSSGTTFAFISSHMAARADRVVNRQEDYAEICRSLLCKSKGIFENVQLLHAYDHVFWLGDLNYRVDIGRHGTIDDFDEVMKTLCRDDFREQLEQYDQLNVEKLSQNVFVGFKEGAIQFRPTYRMEIGKEGLYNNKKNQCPSWTDRVLWHSKAGYEKFVEQTGYDSAEYITSSDHRPVVATFSVLTTASENALEMVKTDQNVRISNQRGDERNRLLDLKIKSLRLYVADCAQDDDKGQGDIPFGIDKDSIWLSKNNSETLSLDTKFGSYESSEHQREDIELTQSAVFRRNVSMGHGVKKSWGKLFIKAHASFIEDVSPSKAVQGCEKQGFYTGSKETQKWLEYEWDEGKIPNIVPFITDKRLIEHKSIVLTIRRKNNLNMISSNVIGSAVIPMAEIFKTDSKSWFRVPILRNGQPAGVITGDFMANFSSYDRRISSAPEVHIGHAVQAVESLAHSDSEPNMDIKVLGNKLRKSDTAGSVDSIYYDAERDTSLQSENPLTVAEGEFEAEANHECKDELRYDSARKHSSVGHIVFKNALSLSDATAKPNIEKELYSYETLMSQKNNLTGTERGRLEELLRDQDFENIFQMTKESFRNLPKWRQLLKKKEINLF